MFRNRMIFMRCELASVPQRTDERFCEVFAQPGRLLLWRGLHRQYDKSDNYKRQRIELKSAAVPEAAAQETTESRTHDSRRGLVALSQRDCGRTAHLCLRCPARWLPKPGRQRKPNPEREDASKQRVGIDHLRPCAKCKERCARSLPLAQHSRNHQTPVHDVSEARRLAA